MLELPYAYEYVEITLWLKYFSQRHQRVSSELYSLLLTLVSCSTPDVVTPQSTVLVTVYW